MSKGGNNKQTLRSEINKLDKEEVLQNESNDIYLEFTDFKSTLTKQ